MPRFEKLPTPASAHERRDGSAYLSFGDPVRGPHSQFDVCCDYDVAKLIVRCVNAHDELVEALEKLLARDERNTCPHEDTHRGGVIWEICDACGSKWADDQGGKPDWQDPPEWVSARAALEKAGRPS